MDLFANSVRNAVTGVFVIVGAAAAMCCSAQTVSYTSNAQALTTTPWNTTLSATQFNPSIGTLTSVTVTLNWSTYQFVSATNNDVSDEQIYSDEQVDAQVLLPNGSTLTGSPPDLILGSESSVVISGQTFVNPTGDLPVGATMSSGPVSTTSTTVSSTFTDAADLAAFTGNGSVSFPAAGAGSGNEIDNGGNISWTVTTESGASVTVTYTYTPSTPPCTTGTSTINSNFNGTAIAAGNYIWFNSVFSMPGFNNNTAATVSVVNQTITFKVGSTPYSISVPDSTITITPGAKTPSTAYSASDGWETAVPSNTSGNDFLSGVGFQVPSGGIPGGAVNSINWTGTFLCNVTGVKINWQWAAAVYSSGFGALGLNGLNVKATDDNHYPPYANSDHPGTPESAEKLGPLGGARGGGGTNYTGSYSGTGTVNPCHMQ